MVFEHTDGNTESVMKDLIEKLKDLDYKQLLMAHGEKIVLGMVGLFVLFSLGSSHWIRYDRKPDEFRAKVVTGEQNLSESQWPAETKKKFDTQKDVGAAVNEMFSETSIEKYSFRTPFIWPLYTRKVKVRDPEYLPVQQLLATPGKVILEFVSKQRQQNSPEEMIAEANRRAAKKQDAAKKQKARKVAVIGEDEQELDSTSPRKQRRPGGGMGSDVPPGMRMQLSGATTGMGQGPQGMGMPQMMSTGMMGRRERRKANARGYRFVAVRGIVPLWNQTFKFSQALNTSWNSAAPFVDYLDFVLERQTAVAGRDPWSKPWQKLDIQTALDILSKVSDFDIDKVPTMYTESVFTMPLPRRAAGEWKEVATHPKVELLTEEQAELQAQLHEKTIKARQKTESEQQTRRGGFAQQQHNVRRMFGTMEGADMETMMQGSVDAYNSPSYQPYNERLAGRSGSSLTRSRMMPNATNTRFSVSRKVLLFRYFDFDVEPGNAYRYRVRLVLRNPNFDRPLHDVVDESSPKGETRETPLSKPSTVAVLRDSAQFFLKKVYAPRGTYDVTASIDVFQWYSDSGTLVLGELLKLEFGEFISTLTKEVTALVLRPADMTMEEEEIEFNTGNVLVDITASHKFYSSEHPELHIGDSEEQQPLSTLNLAVMVDRYGQLVSLDDGDTSRNARHYADDLLAKQSAPWEAIIERAEKYRTAELGTGQGAIDELAKAYSQGYRSVAEMRDANEGGKSRRSSRRKSNPIRKRGASINVNPYSNVNTNTPTKRNRRR